MEIMELFESPSETFPTDFNLNNDTVNISTAREYLADTRKVPLESFQNGKYTLYEFPRAFALINHTDNNTPLIAYIMLYKISFHKFIGRQCAQQITVWRNTKDPNTKNLADKIFFDHLLQNYKTIITDSMQTPDGQRFWDIRIVDALGKGVYVYYVNLIPTREIVEIKNYIDYQKLATNKEIWGPEAKHQARRIVITTDSL